MESLEGLGRKVRTAHDLLSVVKTMKSLAAVNIRQYTAAAESMDAYAAVVAQGWNALLWNHPPGRRSEGDDGPACCLVLGSDQGMCGQFNELAAQCALAAMANGENGENGGGTTVYWAIGDRLRAILEESGRVEEHFPVPVSIAAIGELIDQIVSRFADLHAQGRVGRLRVCSNRLGRAGSYAPQSLQILPRSPLTQPQRKWPGRSLPLLGLRAEPLHAHLFHQHLFALIYTALAHSLASENAARLTAMQAAERNISEMEEDLQARFRETRQNAITAELLDIVSGAEALETS